MNNRSSIPTGLQIVAVLFLLYGISSVIGMVFCLASGAIYIDFGFLGIPTCFGLRRFSQGWRTFALVWIWMWLILCLIAFGYGLLGVAPTYLKLFGIRLAEIAPIWISVVSIPIFVLECWQYRVLTRPQIRTLFLASPHAINVA